MMISFIKQFPIVNTTYVIIYIVLFFVTRQQNTEEEIENKYAFDNKKIDHESYRLITSSVLHANLKHLWGNVMIQLILGSALENFLHFRILIVIIIISGVKGLLLCIYEDKILIIGASGIVYGFSGFLVGYYIIYWSNYTPMIYDCNKSILLQGCAFVVFVALLITIIALPTDIKKWDADDGIAHKSHVFSFFVGFVAFFMTDILTYKHTQTHKQTQTRDGEDEIEIIIL